MSFNRSISEHGSDMLNNQDGEKFSKLDERHALPPPPINPPPRGQRRPPPPLPPPSPTKPSLPARPPAPGMWLDKTAYTMEFSLKSYLIPIKNLKWTGSCIAVSRYNEDLLRRSCYASAMAPKLWHNV